ncbi:hypothetical protein [Saccharothrix sp. NRRL B-16348]|uniref:hypothetical protein n=1 Tax=Saccharothrix sp. NRRL B-16348 TaxID=1415542 RepID=UPI000A6DA82C|nr:hypothetical protein [Saccharothrix sp. NRRL B-16348]
MLVWAHVTRGDYLFAPIVLDHKQHDPGTHQFVEQISIFVTPRNQRGTTLLLNQRLERYATALTRRPGIPSLDRGQPMPTSTRSRPPR